MLLTIPELNIYVYTVTNSKIQLIGEINNASIVDYFKRFVGYGNFEMYVPYNDENVEYCRVNNMLCIGSTGRYCYFITSIQPQKDDNGFIKIKVSGKGLEHLLYYRMLYTTFKYQDVPLSDIMYHLVETNFIDVSTGYERRIMPHLELYEDAYQS